MKKYQMLAVRLSKFLSRVLRHHPELIDLRLDAEGWADVDELCAKVTAAGYPCTRALLEQMIANSDKPRYAFSPDGQKLRANYGHSLSVTIERAAATPPETLYHGTATRFLAAIHAHGLLRKRRQHVHLSADPHTATAVGRRHGEPVVLTVRAGAMHAAGHVFFPGGPGIWLTEQVPVEFLEFPAPPAE